MIKTLLILLILLANDIQQNPGPGNRSDFPCGVCEVPVSWSQVGVCCNNCSVWYHKTCGDISSRNMSYLEKSHVVWHCCKCNSINVDSFTYNSFILHTTNMRLHLVVEPGAQDREVQQALLDTSIDLGLTQVQREPTRYNNLLDLVFTNNPSLCKSSTSIPGISDHAMVVTDFDIIPHYIKQSKRKKYMFNKADWDSIYKEMEQLSTTMESQTATPVEELWSTFTTTVFTIIDKYTPSKVCASRKSLPWLNRNLSRMLKIKLRLYRQAKRSKLE
ncbi:unnamed protein product [Mytilus edulis]|uniref:Zinc finger PHD-type domain-containing protein n=1 Tax=Mytilus edulis TaxID=6550 RepID=A0A8S3QJC9_MYTED|nr:unnamed protein product [Mytilus edulis]